MPMEAHFNIKAPASLRARVETCATLVGAGVPEFVREAIRDKCEAVERLHGQRERAAKAARKETDE